MNPMHAPGSSILSLAYLLFIIYHLTSQTQNFKATASQGSNCLDIVILVHAHGL